MINQLRQFFERPGINKTGICKEAGVSYVYFSEVSKGKQPVTKKYFEKLLKVVNTYGEDIKMDIE